MTIVAALVVAAVLEVCGDAAIRQGLVQRQWLWLALGVALLGAYGFVVNLRTGVDFNRLMGLYIAVFFVTSQAIGALLFGERMSIGLVVGGVLIAAGGATILLTAQ